MLYIVFFEICIDILIMVLVRDSNSFKEKGLMLIGSIIFLILAFLPILYFLFSINKTIRKNKNNIEIEERGE